MIIFEMVFVCYIGCQMSVETSQGNEFNLIGFLGLKEKKASHDFRKRAWLFLKISLYMDSSHEDKIL